MSPDQVILVHQASLDFVNTVYKEQMRARHLEQPGETMNEHSQKLMITGRRVIKEHVRHFLDRIESLISIAQWHQFDELTKKCKQWIQTELLETAKALN